MAYLFTKPSYIAQPRAVPRIDWNHPLTRALAIAHLGSAPSVNLAKNRQVVAYNSALIKAGPGGSGVTWSSTSNVGLRLNNATVIKGSNGDFVGGMTVAVLADPIASTTIYVPFSISSGVNPESYFLFNSNKAGVASSGRVSYVTQAVTGTEAAGVIDGKLHWFIVTYPNASLTAAIYVDGINVSVNATAAPVAFGQTTDSDYVGGYQSSGFSVSGWNVYAVLGWNRALSAAELSMFSARNTYPWEVFARTRKPYFAAPGAAADLTGGASEILRAFAETGGGDIGLGGGAREILKAFTESGGGTIQTNDLSGGAQEILRSLLERGGGNIGLSGGGLQLLRAFQDSGGGISDAPPIQPTTRGGRAWWGYESFDGSNKPWWYKDLADKAKELERQRQIRIDMGILPKPEAKKIAKLTREVDSFIEEMPSPETADEYIAKASALADELELLIDQLQNEDDEELIINMSRFFFNQRAYVCQMPH